MISNVQVVNGLFFFGTFLVLMTTQSDYSFSLISASMCRTFSIIHHSHCQHSGQGLSVLPKDTWTRKLWVTWFETSGSWMSRCPSWAALQHFPETVFNIDNELIHVKYKIKHKKALFS